MKLLKRMVSLLLVLVLIVSIVPTTALANEPETSKEALQNPVFTRIVPNRSGKLKLEWEPVLQADQYRICWRTKGSAEVLGEELISGNITSFETPYLGGGRFEVSIQTVGTSEVPMWVQVYLVPYTADYVPLNKMNVNGNQINYTINGFGSIYVYEIYLVGLDGSTDGVEYADLWNGVFEVASGDIQDIPEGEYYFTILAYGQENDSKYLIQSEMRLVRIGAKAGIKRLSPVNGATDVEYQMAKTQDLYVYFDRPLQLVTTSKPIMNFDAGGIRVYRAVDDYCILNAKENPYLADTSDDINCVTSDPKILSIQTAGTNQLFEPDTEYYVEIDEGVLSFEDGSVNPAIGREDWSFTTKRSDTSEEEKPEAPELSLTLSAYEMTMNIGSTGKIIATPTPTTMAIFWESSDETVVRVDNNGNISALKKGQVTITCTGIDDANQEITAACVVTVFSNVEDTEETIELALNTHKTYVVCGKTSQLRASVTPENISVQWRSSEPEVAEIDASGCITGKKIGETVITCFATNSRGKFEMAYCRVIVLPAVSVTIDAGNMNLKKNTTTKLSYTVTKSENIGTTKVDVISDNKEILSVDGDKLTAVAIGTAHVTITATRYIMGVKIAEATDTCTVNVIGNGEEVRDSFVKFALAQVGKSSDKTSWCGKFIGWCATQIGADNVIGGINACASATYFWKNNISKRAAKKYDVGTVPEKGDIVEFTNSRGVGHVGIVVDVDVDNDTVYVVHGNYKCKGTKALAQVCGPAHQCRSAEELGLGSKWNLKTGKSKFDERQWITAYYRPDWDSATAANEVTGTRIDTYHCPIEVRYLYNNEVLDSATGQLDASFGTMTLGEDGSIQVKLNKYCDVTVAITGTGNGTMDILTEFSNDDGEITALQFDGVLISKNIYGEFCVCNENKTASLNIYENDEGKFKEAWFTASGETAQEKDDGLTHWFIYGCDAGVPANQNIGVQIHCSNGVINELQEEKKTFSDVQVHWAENEIWYVYTNGLMNGVTDDLFAPDMAITRGMVVTILYRLDGEPTADVSGFLDVKHDAYYAEAVSWAAENGIVEGVDPQNFAPDMPITREQLATILYRYAKHKGYDISGYGDLNLFADVAAISSYALSAMEWSVSEGIINGVDGAQLRPDMTATRAQAAAMFMRFCEQIA